MSRSVLIVFGDSFFADGVAGGLQPLSGLVATAWPPTDHDIAARLVDDSIDQTVLLLAPFDTHPREAPPVPLAGVMLYGIASRPELNWGVPVEYLYGDWSWDELRFRLRLLEQRLAHTSLGGVRFTTDRIWSDFRSVPLSLDEFSLLRALARSVGDAVPRSVLVAELSPRLNHLSASRALDMRMSRLRAKLRTVAGSAGARVESVRGRGYRLLIP